MSKPKGLGLIGRVASLEETETRELKRLQAIEAAAKQVFELWPKHWDLVDGGLMVFENSVPLFDERFVDLGVALGILVRDEEDEE